jgi:integrating conjugative element protein (TIGR03746 family)
MQRYRYEIDNVRSHLRTLWAVIGLQLVVILALWIGWMRMPSTITVHIPPDLRSGARLALDEVPPPNVYSFAYYIFQQLNRWPTSGAEDYGRAIFRIAPYLTNAYRNALVSDLDSRGKRGELAHRTRSLQALPGAGYREDRVEVLSADAWVVWLDLELKESVKGMTIKKTHIRYPLRVVRVAVNPETNPWGLALDGFAGDGPKRLHKGAQTGQSPTAANKDTP